MVLCLKARESRSPPGPLNAYIKYKTKIKTYPPLTIKINHAVISYQGTDKLPGELLFVDLPIAKRDDFDELQVHLASQFFLDVSNRLSEAQNITLTGHSLGGGLAGLVASIRGDKGVLLDSYMC